MRALCLHRVVAIYPVGTPLLHSAVGRYFSSFNTSLEHLGSVQPGWQGWHLLQDSTATMSHVMSTTGFVNHPAFSNTQVGQQLNALYTDEACHARAKGCLEDAHYAKVRAAGGLPSEQPFDPAALDNCTEIAALAQSYRKEAESQLNPEVWCLRDAVACMCTHLSSLNLVDGECNAIGCCFALSFRRTLTTESKTGREMYKCRLGHTHSYMYNQVKMQSLKTEQRRAKLNKTLPRPPVELLRAANNTLELESLLEGEVTATDTQISFLNMPRDDCNSIFISREWVRSSAGQAILAEMESHVPLLTFFTLFGRLLASPAEVAACARYFPTQLSYRRHHSAPFVDTIFFNRSEARGGHGNNASAGASQRGSTTSFALTMPTSVYTQTSAYEQRLRATEGRSLSGRVNQGWITRVTCSTLPAALL